MEFREKIIFPMIINPLRKTVDYINFRKKRLLSGQND